MIFEFVILSCSIPKGCLSKPPASTISSGVYPMRSVVSKRLSFATSHFLAWDFSISSFPMHYFTVFTLSYLTFSYRINFYAHIWHSLQAKIRSFFTFNKSHDNLFSISVRKKFTWLPKALHFTLEMNRKEMVSPPN